LSEARRDRSPTAFILGDVVGLPRLFDLDAAGTLTALARHKREVIDPTIEAHGGLFVEAPDDALLIWFGSPIDAVLCAAELRAAILSKNAALAPERRILFRLGVGTMGVDGGDLSDEGLAKAQRLLTLCDPGGLCLSGSIEASIRGRTPLRLRSLGMETAGADPQDEAFVLSPPAPPPSPTQQQPMTQAPVGPGTRLNDSYEIDASLASGGMWEIFRGHEIHTEGMVAIKLIRLDMSGSEASLALFQKEASALKQIYHEAIVRYYAFSFDPTVRRHYLAMEFVDGTPLSEMLRRGPLSFEDVTALRLRVAAALQVAHERGIVHRDVSPDNIIIPASDVSRAKIIDFGIARSTALGAGTVIGGGFAGKYNYVSPEQLGLAGGDVTARSDIYSFGLVLAEALIGQPIDMGGSQADIIERRRSVPDLGGIDMRLRPLIQAMLAPEPAGRPASMAAVAAWTPSRADPVPPARVSRPAPAQPPEPYPARGRWIAGGLAGVVLLCGAGIAAYLALPQPPVKLPETPFLPSGPAPAQRPPVLPETPPTRPPVPETTDLPGTNPAPMPPSSIPDDIGRITKTIVDYDGGNCFFARPISIQAKSAGVDGFAESSAAFDGLNRAIVQAAGFEPDITGHVVWSHQCAAVDFLRHIYDGQDGAPLKLFLKSLRVGAGQKLAGEVQGFGDRAVTLVQVREDGTVVDLSSALRPSDGSRDFELQLSSQGAGGPFPQLLIAMASNAPLEMSDKPVSADAFFPALMKQAAEQGQKLSASAQLVLVKS
jgi:serine/threonine-protein kinase